jgi:phosphate acyltransferase
MTERITVALDALGGDHAPHETVAGALEAVAADEHVRVLLCGPPDALRAELRGSGGDAIEIVDAPVGIGYDEDPVFVVRSRPDSSLVTSCRLVAEGRAAAAVSAGPTGAMMAASLLTMRRIPGVLRPAIAQPLPCSTGVVVLIDCGANADCRPEHLLQFAHMGSAFATTVLGIERPTIGLLSNGEEEGKGNALVLEAHALLRDAPDLAFHGNVEGRDVPGGVVDVVVTDGFTGNVVLKVLEGTGKWLMQEIKDAAMSSWGGKVGGALLRPRLRPLRERVDPDTYGGAYLVGLRGLSVIAHGTSGRVAVRNAILNGAVGARMGVVEQLEARLGRKARTEAPAAAPAPTKAPTEA